MAYYKGMVLHMGKHFPWLDDQGKQDNNYNFRYMYMLFDSNSVLKTNSEPLDIGRQISRGKNQLLKERDHKLNIS